MPLNINKDKENLLQRLERITELIKGSDTKASIVIAGIGIFFTIFSSSEALKGIKLILNNSIKNIDFAKVIFLGCVLLSLGAIAYGIFCLISVLIPRMKKFSSSMNDVKKDSLYFFGEISEIDYTTFRQKMYSETNTKRELEDLLSQIYINSYICNVKYNYYKKGILFSFGGITVFIILYLVGLLIY